MLVPALLVIESLHYVFARLLVDLLPPSTAGLYMLAIATVEVALLARGRVRPAIFLRHWRFFGAIGLLVAVNTNIGFLAMRYVDPGTAALLTRTSVICGVGLGLLWLGERLDRVEMAGAVAALAGTVVVSIQPGDHLRLGSLLIILATLLYALHSAVVKRWGSEIPFTEFFFYRVATTTVFLAALTAAQHELFWPAASAWPMLVLSATVNVVISRALYYLALRRMDMSLLTIILTLSPVVTVLWSLLLFGSRPSLQELAGGGAILAGVLVVSARRGGYLPRVS
jgi:O-acetylserine/cysteine efflux transporter